MRKILLLFCLTIISLDVLAYDYQAVYSHNTTYYQDAYNYIAPMRIDSVKISDGDSIFYPLKSIRGKSPYYCFTPDGGSLLGDKVIVNQDYNYFFNRNGDSIKIKASAAVNDEWIVFQKNDMIITGKVEKITEESFLSIVDSVKHISFYISDAGITKYKNPVLISKKYGMLKSYDFYTFPNIENSNSFSDFFNSSILTLVGMTNPRLGIQNLTSFDIFDFQPGDELHIRYEFDCIGPNYADFKSDNIKTILNYLSRADYPDSIVYQFLRKVDKNGVVSEALGKQKIIKDYYFEKLPMETIFREYEAYNIMMINSTIHSMGTKNFMSNLRRLHKIDNSSFENIVGYGYDCWVTPIWDGCFPSKVYLEGLGGPYSNCGSFWGCFQNEGLVYFKKGDTEWGEPLVITGVSELETMQGTISPNPAKDIVTLSLPAVSHNFSLTIIDKLGRIVKSESFQNTDQATLNIMELVSGLYFLRVTAGGKTEVHKLIKE